MLRHNRLAVDESHNLFQLPVRRGQFRQSDAEGDFFAVPFSKENFNSLAWTDQFTQRFRNEVRIRLLQRSHQGNLGDQSVFFGGDFPCGTIGLGLKQILLSGALHAIGSCLRLGPYCQNSRSFVRWP
jgi:hypothetical protein